ncbi:RCC1 domain-containing protein [Paenibacillus herberti]|nr:hypothetical protein [Paenibacillus herberti]
MNFLDAAIIVKKENRIILKISQSQRSNMHNIIIVITMIIITSMLSSCGQQSNVSNQNKKTNHESDITVVEAGGYHSVALKKDGTVWSWGRNNVGQLGDGLSIDRFEPSKINGLENIIALSGKVDHTLAVTKEGQVWAWGYNPDGRIDGRDEVHPTPVLIQGLDDIVSVSAGGSFSLALDKHGTVWSWGSNLYGQLGNGNGNGNGEDNPLPRKIISIHDIVQIEAGGDFALALSKDGTVWAWGRNSFNQLGNGSDKDETKPIKVPNLKVIKVSAGDNHSIALAKDGLVWSWGYNSNGQIGDGTANVYAEDGSLQSNHNKGKPIKIKGLKDIQAVEGGFNHSIALAKDGGVWTWGWNEYGQLGNGTNKDQLTPVKLNGISDIHILNTGYYHTIALGSNALAYSWGDNTYGQVGTSAIDRMIIADPINIKF